jgi:hypothetical protein
MNKSLLRPVFHPAPGLLLCLSLFLALGACGLGSSGNSETVALSAQTLASTNMPSGEIGTATLTDMPNSTTQVTIMTSGGTDTGEQASEIQTGACGTTPEVVFALLNNVPEGNQEIGNISTVINTPLSMLTGGKYAIVIHNSADINVIQSCGTIP